MVFIADEVADCGQLALGLELVVGKISLLARIGLLLSLLLLAQLVALCWVDVVLRERDVGYKQAARQDRFAVVSRV